MLNIKKLRENYWSIIIPSQVRFISKWDGYDFLELPDKCIIDKQIPGCGYTEWGIRNDRNVILCSPRKILLENKTDQHLDEVFLVVNELDKDLDVDRKISLRDDDKTELRRAEKEIETENKFQQFGLSSDDIKRNEGIYNKIYEEYVQYCNKRGNLPHKILVTYDSYYIVKKILTYLGTFDQFFTIVDEFQSVLHDAKFKSTTEVEFMSVLKDVKRVQFVSATPMLDEYIQMLDDFKNLPYFVFDWATENPTRVIKPNLKVLIMKSIGEVLPDIIKNYKDGKFEKIYINGKEIVSDEAVFYVNSVNHIISMISKCGLKPEECNILCSKTPINEKKIRTKLGKEWTIGKVPLKDEKPKMFTFCTRTVYLGADFYSKCAKSYIFSDSNSDCLAVDISQDLPQILGRQRLSENPWKNSAVFYYRSTCDWRKMKKEDFDAFIEKKKSMTKTLMTAYDGLTDPSDISNMINRYRKMAKILLYKDDYVAVDSKSGKNIPVFNNYVYVSDIRAFAIQQKDYADRFSVFNEIENTFKSEVSGVLGNHIKYYESLGNNISDRIKYICEYVEPDLRKSFLDQLTNDDYAKSYILQLGENRCKALSYNVSKIRKELGIIMFDSDDLRQEIYRNFKVGDRKSKSDIKTILSNIYNAVNYKKTAKAIDIDLWFETKSILLTISGKRVNGFELLKKK